jgi:trimeric autotransporter adhesin
LVCNALFANTTGASNVAIGSLALDANTTASSSVAIGNGALGANTVGSYSVAIGFSALAAQNPASAGASFNTAVGTEAGTAVTTGTTNASFGARAGATSTTGFGNTCLGNDADVDSAAGYNRIAIGNQVTNTANNRMTVGAGSNVASLELDGSDTSWAASSDERLKENVVSSTAGLSFINDLRPVTYNWKKAKDVPSDLPQYVEGSDEPCLGHTYGTELHGFIAQEVKTVIDNHEEIKDGQSVWQTDDTTVQTLAPSALVPMLVKALQEADAKIEALTTRITALEG